MSRARVSAVVGAVAVAASLFVIAPLGVSAAYAATYTLYGTEFEIPTNQHTMMSARVAASADGTRVAMITSVKGAAECETSMVPAFAVGVTTSNSTIWSDPQLLPANTGIACETFTDWNVALSDDGTRGLLTWRSSSGFSYAVFNWGLTEERPADPSVYSKNFTMDNINSLSYSAAMSGDGSRAIIGLAKVAEGSTGFYYSDIDLERPGVDNWQAIQSSDVPAATINVDVSDDGEVIAFSMPGSPEGSTNAWSELNVYTCRVNCYTKRLKHFSATVPAGEGAMMGARVNLDATGSRLLLSWLKYSQESTSLLRTAVLNPSAVGKEINFASQVKLSTVSAENWTGYVISDDTLRFAAWTITDQGGAGGRVDVTPGTIGQDGTLTKGVTSSVMSPFTNWVNMRMAGSPERIVFSTTVSSSGVAFKVFASDSSTAPKSWSLIYTGDVPSLLDDSTHLAVAKAADVAIYASNRMVSWPATNAAARVFKLSNLGAASAVPVITVTGGGSAVSGKTLSASNGT